VSLLENDLESRKQLESAVGSIAERLSRADAISLELEAKRLESERGDILKKLEEIRKQLAEARADEYRDIVIAGKTLPPAGAARNVAKEKRRSGGFQARSRQLLRSLLLQVSWPILYRTNTSLSREDEIELAGHLPELHDLRGRRSSKLRSTNETG